VSGKYEEAVNVNL